MCTAESACTAFICFVSPPVTLSTGMPRPAWGYHWPGRRYTARLSGHYPSYRGPLLEEPALDLRQKLYVRPCWPALWAGMQAAAMSQRGSGTGARLALAGTSGTGRHLFLLYALWRLARDPAAAAVVVQYDFARAAYMRGQKVYLGSCNDFSDLLQLPGTWLLGDENDFASEPDCGAANMLMVTMRPQADYEVCI